MSEENQKKHKERCPQCNKLIDVPYGYDIPCPECETKLNVFDPKEREYKKDGYNASRGFNVGPLSGSGSGNRRRPSARSSNEPRGTQGTNMAARDITFKDIGGMDETIEKLDLLVNGRKKYPALWERVIGKEPRGILLTGPPGTGKTLLIQALATESGRKAVLVQGSEIKGWRVGDSENNLIAAYESAAPDGLFVIDELDAIGSKRDQMVNTTESSVVSTLCSLLDGAKYKDNVIVIATTNRPHALDTSLRRHGRFDIEIEVLPPTQKGREEIFRIHVKGLPLSDDIDFSELARASHGFTGADIAGVCSFLKEQTLKEAAQKIKQGFSEEDVAKDLWFGMGDFLRVISKTTPSILRGVTQTISEVKWEDVGGLSHIKEEILRMVVWPVKHRDVMETLKMRLPKGILLYGPPGTGKTLLARAIAGEIDYNFIVVNGPALIKKWMGDSEDAVRDLFWRARMARPCIIFIDEMDSLAPVRGSDGDNHLTDRIVSQILTEMDGVLALEDVFVIGATNRKDMIDPALTRPGRLDLEYEIALPDKDARKQIFEIHLRDVPLKIDVDTDDLAERSQNRSGADIEWICSTAKRIAAERYIEAKDFPREEASVGQEDLLLAFKEFSESRKEKESVGFLRGK